jgi:adenosylcobinamide hydrolase
MQAAEKILTTSMGDAVYRYEKSIVVFFKGHRKVLSTSVYNGGYHEDLTTVFNHDCTVGPGMPCEMLAPTYEGHMRIIAGKIGLDPDKTTGMGTAACMDNAVSVSETYKELTVTAVVTGGIEHNAGRAGDPADYYKPGEKPPKPGTINILLFLDSDMPEGTITRALVTCTEAKTAAIQELLQGSLYSQGLATGSGTDQTIIVANADSSLYLEGAGKHAKMGELIGRVVKQAVKAALFKQTGLCPASQHHALRRLERFGVSREKLWQAYLEQQAHPVLKPEFVSRLEQLVTDGEVVTLVSLYAHLLDQYAWELLPAAETAAGCQQLLQLLAAYLKVPEPPGTLEFTTRQAVASLTQLLVQKLLV